MQKMTLKGVSVTGQVQSRQEQKPRRISGEVLTAGMSREQVMKGWVITICFVVMRLVTARLWDTWFDMAYHLTLSFLLFLLVIFVTVSLGLVYFGFTRWVGVDLKSWWVRSGRIWGDIKWAVIALVLGGIIFLGAVLGLYFLGLVPPDLMAAPAGDVPLEQTLAQIPVDLVLGWFFGFAIAAFTEETIFRGFILGQFAAKLNPGWANLLQAALFSFSHLGMEPRSSIGALVFGLLFRFASGLVFGWLRMKRGTLLASGIVHGVIG
jgi:membrane protease YdiL (CAAX protease family)